MLPLILTKLMLENVDFFFGRQVGNLLLSPGIKETIPPTPPTPPPVMDSCGPAPALHPLHPYHWGCALCAASLPRGGGCGAVQIQ